MYFGEKPSFPPSDKKDLKLCLSIKAEETCDLLKKLNELMVKEIVKNNYYSMVAFNYQDIQPETLDKLKLIFANTYKNYFYSQSEYLNFNKVKTANNQLELSEFDLKIHMQVVAIENF